MTWLTVLPFELVVANITIDYWGLKVPGWVWITIFLCLLSFIQLFGVKAYGEGKSALRLRSTRAL